MHVMIAFARRSFFLIFGLSLRWGTVGDMSAGGCGLGYIPRLFLELYCKGKRTLAG